MSTQRPRGRPRGTGKNDEVFLNQVADHLVKSPALKPTTAMKRVLYSRQDWEGASEAAVLRRWQEKWKAGAETYLTAARERAAARIRSSAAGSGSYARGLGVNGAFERMMQATQRMQDLIDPPHKRVYRKMEERWQRIDQAMNPIGSALKQIEEMSATRQLTKALDDIDPIGSALRRMGW